jgi:hypothetical protein
MASKYVISSYVITGSIIYTANTTNFHIKNSTLSVWWDLLKFDNNEGATTATISFMLSPLIIPVYTITLPFIYGICHDKS